MSATYEYGARGELPPVKLTWYQGTAKPLHYRNKTIPQWDSAVLFIGDKGTILCGFNGANPKLIPESRMQEFKQPTKTLPRSWIRRLPPHSATASLHMPTARFARALSQRLRLERQSCPYVSSMIRATQTFSLSQKQYGTL